MTDETFKKKNKILQEQYIYWAMIRNRAIKELQTIIKKAHKLEEKYYESNKERFEKEEEEE